MYTEHKRDCTCYWCQDTKHSTKMKDGWNRPANWLTGYWVKKTGPGQYYKFSLWEIDIRSKVHKILRGESDRVWLFFFFCQLIWVGLTTRANVVRSKEGLWERRG